MKDNQIRVTTSVGEMLKEEFGFNDPETVKAFNDKYELSEKITQGILDNKYPALLTIHYEALADFTGQSIEFWQNLHNNYQKSKLKE